MPTEKISGDYCVKVVLRVLTCASIALISASAWPQPLQTSFQGASTGVTFTLDPSESRLRWMLGSTLHTVHGTFALKRGEVFFDPSNGSASGEIVADAASGASGNESRDKKMHREILESRRYSDIVFRPSRVEGKVSAGGTSSVRLQGVFVLHGAQHEMSVPIQTELSGNHWKGSAKFGIPYIAWGLKSPNTFLLKADPVVEIELEMSGTLQGTIPP
jgi:polyisoprenoid-binding protein YceI